MIALDTNILVYAVREEAPFHAQASELVKRFAEGDPPWAFFWQSAYEFVKIVTHPKIYKKPAPLAEAVEQIEAFLDSPSLVLLGHRGAGPGGTVYLRSGRQTGTFGGFPG